MENDDPYGGDVAYRSPYSSPSPSSPPSSPSSPSPPPSSSPRLCRHYIRRCEIYTSCCERYFPCRLCHDAHAESLDLDHPTCTPEVVTQLRCVSCGSEQPPGGSDGQTTTCASCHVSFGAYACIPCRLFDDDVSKQQFHCDGCGICRVGGRANFFHCVTCGACFATSTSGDHKCIPGVTKQNCPVCLDDLFGSVLALAVLGCGHVLHRSCMKSMLAHGSTTCPWCKKSMAQIDWSGVDLEVGGRRSDLVLCFLFCFVFYFVRCIVVVASSSHDYPHQLFPFLSSADCHDIHAGGVPQHSRRRLV